MKSMAFLPVVVFAIVGCQNVTVDFDEFPDGSPVPAWNGTNAGAVAISTQFAGDGVLEFDPDGGALLIPLPDSNAPSQPNHVCAWEASAFTGTPTTITLEETTCNVWLDVTLGQPTVDVRDSSGTVMESRVVGLGRHRFNQCGTKSVRISGPLGGQGRYCFDDFTWQNRIP